MKERYRLFLRRKSVYYAFDNATKTFQSLKTKDEAEGRAGTSEPNTSMENVPHPQPLTRPIPLPA